MSGQNPLRSRERFQYFRTVITDLGPVDVRVDFLTPETEDKAPGGSYRSVQGIDTLTLKGGDLAFARTEEGEVLGKLPDGENVVVSVQVTSTVPFLILKSLALFDRRERKDAYDIYHRLKNYPGELEDLVKEFEPYWGTNWSKRAWIGWQCSSLVPTRKDRGS